MFKLCATTNIISQKAGGSSSQEKGTNTSKNDTVHVHGMWHQPTPLPRVTSKDQKFREKLVTAYIGMANGTRDLPPNVKAHLWTDRKSMHALYMPVVNPNGTEIELPHSMLAKAPVSMHLEGELEELIAQVQDEGLRTQLKELYNHPAGENIGLRSDLVRLLYGILYSENTKGVKGEQTTEFNIHIDIDTLAEANFTKALNQQSPKISSRPDELQRAKMELQAMHKSLEMMKLPAKPKPLSKEEVAALADRPQKSWSVQTSVEKSGSPVVIPNKLQKRGYVSHMRENDIIGMIPGHKKAIKVANRTHCLLKTGNFKSELSEPWAQSNRNYVNCNTHLKEQINLFHRLNGGLKIPKSKALDQQQVIDYFRLAEKIRKMRPALQEIMNALTFIARDETQNMQERDIAKMRIEALRAIYKTSCSLVESFVYKSSYFPQAATSSREEYKEFLELLQPVFGVNPPYVSTNSWKGVALESTERNSYAGSAYEVQAMYVFEEIKAMIRPSETE